MHFPLHPEKMRASRMSVACVANNQRHQASREGAAIAKEFVVIRQAIFRQISPKNGGPKGQGANHLMTYNCRLCLKSDILQGKCPFEDIFLKITVST